MTGAGWFSRSTFSLYWAPGRRRKATRFPSGDQAGSLSRSTLGASQVIFCAAGIIDADEAVLAAARDEGDPRAVGRPDGVAVPARGLEEELGLRRFTRRARVAERHAVDQAILDNEDPPAVRRDDRAVAGADAPGVAAPRADRPDRLLDAGRVARGVGHPALAVRVPAADINDDRAVAGYRQAGDLEHLVDRVIRETDGRVIRGGGGPDVPRAFLVEHPGEAVGVPGRYQVRRVRRAEHLFEGEGPFRLLGGGGRAGDRAVRGRGHGGADQADQYGRAGRQLIHLRLQKGKSGDSIHNTLNSPR